jgi:pimeloyl-ACP methyl ester carboxylesterase
MALEVLSGTGALVELENAGHCAHDECPERVNFELLDWIRNQVLLPAV